jgi:hypothetical protein
VHISLTIGYLESRPRNTSGGEELREERWRQGSS